MQPKAAALALLLVLGGCARARELARETDAQPTTAAADDEASDEGAHSRDDVVPRDASSAAEPRRADDPGAPDQPPAADSSLDVDRPGDTCFTPSTRDDGFAPDASLPGCACRGANSDRIVCANGSGVVCVEGRWRAGFDGACSPRPDPSLDASLAVNPSCFSPSAAATDFALRGCECQETVVNITGFCVDSSELVCEDGRWQRTNKGLCLAPGTISEEACRARGGEPLGLSPQPLHHLWRDQPLCPEGRQLLGAVTRVRLDDAGVEAGVAGQAPCCARP